MIRMQNKRMKGSGTGAHTIQERIPKEHERETGHIFKKSSFI